MFEINRKLQEIMKIGNKENHSHHIFDGKGRCRKNLFLIKSRQGKYNQSGRKDIVQGPITRQQRRAIDKPWRLRQRTANA